MDRPAARRPGRLTRGQRGRQAERRHAGHPDPTRGQRGRHGAEGFVTVQFVAAAALSLVLLVLLANVLVAGYARGVVRAALDEGARAGARAEDGPGECWVRATAVLDDLLAGPLRDGVEPVRCTVDDDRVRASTRAVVSGWLPTVPGWVFEVSATAHRERLE